MLGAALNAVAGGGSFIGFPSLLFAGVPPVPSNVTNNIAMWTGAIASGSAYRDRLDVPRRILIPLLIATVLGGIVGALLLLQTSAHALMRMIPWFLLLATLLFAFGKKLARSGRLNLGHGATTTAVAITSVLQFFISVYGGYFGAGMSIMVLAMLSAAGMVDIHAMNALKSVLQIAVTGVAGLYFVFARAVYWPQAIVMMLGALIGGYFGAQFAKRVPQPLLKALVVLVGTGLTIYFFVKTY